MIAPLRRCHRRLFGLLSILLPTLFVAALVERPDTAKRVALPESLARGQVLPLERPDEPDLLLYWSPEAPRVGAELPEGALLLGALRSGRLHRLDGPSVPDAGGTHFAYSLIDQAVTELLSVGDVRGGTR